MINREKYEVIKAMNTIVKSLNNENAYFGVWIFTVPDEADEEDLEDFAEEENDNLFKAAVNDFTFIMKHYLKDGIYIDRKVY